MVGMRTTLNTKAQFHYTIICRVIIIYYRTCHLYIDELDLNDDIAYDREHFVCWSI